MLRSAWLMVGLPQLFTVKRAFVRFAKNREILKSATAWHLAMHIFSLQWRRGLHQANRLFRQASPFVVNGLLVAHLEAVLPQALADRPGADVVPQFVGQSVEDVSGVHGGAQRLPDLLES